MTVRPVELGFVHGPVPPPVPLFGRHWPAPALPPAPRVRWAAAAAGTGVAVAIPEGRAGVGWLVAGLVLVAAATVIGWRPLRPPGTVATRPVAFAETLWMPAAVALAAAAAVRDAEWLFVLCLLGACAAGSLAVAGRWFRSVVRGVLGVPVAAGRSVSWLGRGGLPTPRRVAGLPRLVASFAVGLGLLAVFGPLLASADPAFEALLGGLVPDLAVDSVLAWVFRFLFGAAGVLGVAFLLAAPPTTAPQAVRPSRLRLVEWALPIGLLVGLFALYVAVTASTLFGSDALVRTTGNLTYAEYARGGFWQLLVVTVLTLVVIAAGRRWAPAGSPGWSRALLGALAVLTLVIVASALHRMWLYQQVYGFTVLRLLVLTVELWLAVGFLLTLVSVLRVRPLRHGRGMVAAGIGALLALAVLNPERFVAEHDVTRYAGTGRIDVSYLSQLSADAVPALERLPEPLRTCALAPIAARLGAGDEGWQSANLSRSVARARLAGLSTAACRESFS